MKTDDVKRVRHTPDVSERLPLQRSSYNARPEFDSCRRAESYTLAHKTNPQARAAELNEALALMPWTPGMTTVEIGAGQGFLTLPLYNLVGGMGQLIAVDNSQKQLAALNAACPGVRCICATSERIPLRTQIADTVISLANFHHIPDKAIAFSECARLLKSGGALVIADVLDGTPVQVYFDDVVDKICSTGHKHKFLTRARCQDLCRDNDFDLVHWELKAVPWHFPSKESAGLFLQRIHDAACPPDFCWSEAASHIGFHRTEHMGVALEWQLFFMVALKHGSRH